MLFAHGSKAIEIHVRATYPVQSSRLLNHIHRVRFTLPINFCIEPSLAFPDLVASLHRILDYVDLVVHQLRVPEVVAHPSDVSGAHVNGRMLDRLRIAVVLEEF